LTLQHEAEQACFPWVATLDKWPCLCQEKNDEAQHTTHHHCLFQSIIDVGIYREIAFYEQVNISSCTG